MDNETMHRVQIQVVSIRELLADGDAGIVYEVPPYQRAYAWGETEIGRLLEDLYLASQAPDVIPYYLGTLVTMQRGEKVQEVVDGQQRLTTLTLLCRWLGLISANRLRFRNRPAANGFLKTLFRDPAAALATDEAGTMRNALRYFQDYRYASGDPDKAEIAPYQDATQALRNYLLDKVKLIHVTLPEKSDIALYFEAMNNRGEQLKDHEALKALLMQKAKDQGKPFDSDLWDACAKMDTPLAAPKNENTAVAEDTDEGTQARMDFPNFLLLALDAYLRTPTYEPNVPLDERLLLRSFREVMKRPNFEASEFLEALKALRLRFDTYVIRAKMRQGEIQRWVLSHWEPNNIQTGKKLVPTFNADGQHAAEQQEIILLQSLLEVTYPSHRYRRWLQQFLREIDPERSATATIALLRGIIAKRVAAHIAEQNKKGNDWACLGTGTPRLVLNLLDYLIWERDGKKASFIFRHRNSIEHFTPRNDTYLRDGSAWREVLDTLGNLCLMSGSENASLSNHSPEEKVNEWGNKPRSPKQVIMYRLAEDGEWTPDACREHTKVCRDLVEAFLNATSQTP